MVASPRDCSSYQLTQPIAIGGENTHYFLGPECHFGMVQTTMAVGPICAVDETMSMVSFASNCCLKLFVGSELRVSFSIQRWRDIILAASLLGNGRFCLLYQGQCGEVIITNLLLCFLSPC